jgi:hypothetical protein
MAGSRVMCSRAPRRAAAHGSAKTAPRPLAERRRTRSRRHVHRPRARPLTGRRARLGVALHAVASPARRTLLPGVHSICRRPRAHDHARRRRRTRRICAGEWNSRRGRPRVADVRPIRPQARRIVAGRPAGVDLGSGGLVTWATVTFEFSAAWEFDAFRRMVTVRDGAGGGGRRGGGGAMRGRPVSLLWGRRALRACPGLLPARCPVHTPGRPSSAASRP